MKNKTCKRLIVQGVTSYSIQAVNFREKIEEFVRINFNAQSIKALGRISNLKSGEVEIVFCSSKKTDLDQLIEYLMKIEGIQHIHQYDYASNQEFTNFRIERSDDLSEMVWALRGAGIRFKEATDALEKIYITLEERDKKVAIGRMLALYFELLHNRRLLRRADERNRDKINTVALAANIEKPAIPERDFVYLTNEVYSDFEDFGQGMRLNVESLSRLVLPTVSFQILLI